MNDVDEHDVVDLCTPPPSPRRPAGQPLREVDGVVLLDSDAGTTTVIDLQHGSIAARERRRVASEGASLASAYVTRATRLNGQLIVA